MGFVRWMITKMANKLAATYQFAFVDTLLSFITWLLSNFLIWIALIKRLPKFQYGLCLINEMATKMATKCLTWSFVTQFLPNFIYGLPSSNFWDIVDTSTFKDAQALCLQKEFLIVGRFQTVLCHNFNVDIKQTLLRPPWTEFRTHSCGYKWTISTAAKLDYSILRFLKHLKMLHCRKSLS